MDVSKMFSEGGEEREEAGVNVSEEGERTEEARKVVMLEKGGNTEALYGELIMDSVGSPEE